ncbi:SHIRT domain-containing protein, partial [Peptoniphilus asaccharolyticus]
MKRIISFILAILMLISIVPVDLAYTKDAPKEQGKIKVEYKDSKTNAAIDRKYQLKDQEYPTEKTGNKDEAIKDEVFVKDKAPKFLGYNIKSITTAPVPNPPATANYTKDGDYTVIYTYDKLDDIIGPEKFPDGYVAVKFFADDSANDRGEFTGKTKAVVYAVNPINTEIDKDAKTLKGNKADGSEHNVTFPEYTVKDDFKATWKINDTDPWKMNPENAIGADKKIDVNKLGGRLDLTFTAQYTEVKKPGNCLTEDKLQAQFEEAANPMFDKVGSKEGVYIGHFDKAKKEVTVYIIDKTQGAKEISGTGLIAGLTELYKNNYLTKIKVGNRTEQDLKKLAEAAPNSGMTVEQLFKFTIGSDLLNAVQDDGNKTGKLADFIDKNVVLKLTIQQPGCDNAVVVEYTVSGKEAAASKLKDKLDTQDIKVWVGDTIDWKNGVKIKDDAQDKAALEKVLKEELAKANAKVEDLGENGTIAEPKTARKSDAQNLPNGKKGNLKVTFSDGSTLVVNGQTLYVAGSKNKVVEGDDTNTIVPGNLPDNKVAVKFLLGEGVKIGDKNGDKTTPVLYETYYVKPNTGLEKSDIPTIEVLNDSYKNNKWHNGDAELQASDYTNITTAKTFVAKAVEKGKGSIEYSYKFFNSKKPTEELGTTLVKGNFDPELPKSEKKNEGDEVTLPTLQDVTRAKDDKGRDLGLQGTWKFDGWYKASDTTFTTKLTKLTISSNAEENKLVGKWVLTETETAKVTRKFDIDPTIKGDLPTNQTLPEGVNDQKVNDTTNYIGSTQTPGKDNFTAVPEIINGKQGTWTFKEWNPTELVVDKDESKNVFTGTWTWAEKGKITVKYVFKTDPADKKLPEVLNKLKPENFEGEKAVYPENVPADPTAPDTSSEAAKAALVEMKDGKKVGKWKAGDWVKTTDKDEN